jgi:hypothetical protein
MQATVTGTRRQEITGHLRVGGVERELYCALLSTAFYAGPRLGELRDLPSRNVDFDGSMLRIESGFSEGTRSTPEGKRTRSTPLAPTGLGGAYLDAALAHPVPLAR